MDQMTKGELRRARKAAREVGASFTGALALDSERHGSQEFTETYRGYKARDSWARRYDALNGAPEGDFDR
jgi:hypothetical protein